MFETKNAPVKTIKAQEAAARWDQAFALFSTFTQVWLSNPKLAKQAGRRIEEFVMPLAEVQKRHADDLA
jgi:hypothetical protein